MYLAMDLSFLIGSRYIIANKRSLGNIFLFPREVRRLGGWVFCGIEPMRKAYKKNRQIKLSIPALVAALWIIRGFAAVRKADGIVSGFII
ncbi:MAG: hypothetical protein IJN83_01580 [Clostridia bacterium]|nr:hypothetical protein [Clostridia bacterium]